ncbi:MAG: sugar phosphate nucleotidyltransferase [Candidatus Bathyarchaeia archaeon]
MKAVVLAAGEGVRLRPFTLTRPKHLLPLCGRPLLEYTLQALKAVNIHDVAIIIGYKGDMIRNYFGTGISLGLSLTYIEQKQPLGTANAVAFAKEYTGGDDFLLVHGDLLIDSTAVKRLLDTYALERMITMGVVPAVEPTLFGVVHVENGKVKSIAEKPEEAGGSNLVNAGMYILNNEVFREVAVTGISVRGEYELPDALKPFIKRGEVRAALINADSWIDIGRPWDLLEANERIMRSAAPRVEGTIDEGAHLVGNVIVEAGARVRSGAYIEGPVFVGAGSDVGPNCYLRPFTSLGSNVRIGNACEVKNSVIMQGTHIGHLSYVGDSVIGEDCNLGAGTITANLRFDNRLVKVSIKGKPVDSGLRKLGTFMGDGAKTGIGTLIMPGVKIGCGAWIGPGVILMRDVEENTQVMVDQQTIRRRLEQSLSL